MAHWSALGGSCFTRTRNRFSAKKAASMSKIWLNNLETVFENVAHISTSELLPALELAIGCQKSGSIVDALELLGLIPRRPVEVWGPTGW